MLSHQTCQGGNELSLAYLIETVCDADHRSEGGVGAALARQDGKCRCVPARSPAVSVILPAKLRDVGFNLSASRRGRRRSKSFPAPGLSPGAGLQADQHVWILFDNKIAKSGNSQEVGFGIIGKGYALL